MSLSSIWSQKAGRLSSISKQHQNLNYEQINYLSSIPQSICLFLVFITVPSEYRMTMWGVPVALGSRPKAWFLLKLEVELYELNFCITSIQAHALLVGWGHQHWRKP